MFFFFFDTEGEIVIACNQILKMLAFVIVSSGTFSSVNYIILYDSLSTKITGGLGRAKFLKKLNRIEGEVQEMWHPGVGNILSPT